MLVSKRPEIDRTRLVPGTSHADAMMGTRDMLVAVFESTQDEVEIQLGPDVDATQDCSTG